MLVGIYWTPPLYARSQVSLLPTRFPDFATALHYLSLIPHSTLCLGRGPSCRPAKQQRRRRIACSVRRLWNRPSCHHHAKGYDDSVLSQVRCFQATKRWRDLRVKVSGKRRLPWQALTPHSLALDTWREQLLLTWSSQAIRTETPCPMSSCSSSLGNGSSFFVIALITASVFAQAVVQSPRVSQPWLSR